MFLALTAIILILKRQKYWLCPEVTRFHVIAKNEENCFVLLRVNFIDHVTHSWKKCPVFP